MPHRIDGERPAEPVVLAAGAEDLRAEPFVVDERPAGLLLRERRERDGGPRHGVRERAVEREARDERGVGVERRLRRREGRVGRVRDEDGVLPERTHPGELVPRPNRGEDDAVGVARDAAPARGVVGRELAAAPLGVDAGRLHAEGAQVGVGRDVEGDRPPDARHAQVVAARLGEVREVERVDVLGGVVRLSVAVREEPVVRQPGDAAEDGPAVLLAHELERGRFAEAEGVGGQVVVGG